MDELQTIRQIAYVLRSRVWTSGAEPVFHRDSVVEQAGMTWEAARELPPPFALLGVGNGDVDDQNPLVCRQEIEIDVGVRSDGSQAPRFALIGGARASELVSDGRGILEVQRELFAAVAYLNSAGGIRIQYKGSHKPAPRLEADSAYWAIRTYRFEAIITNSLFYHPPDNLESSVSGAVNTLTWTLPPDRFDRYKVILRRASGATAPASVSDGTGVTLASNLATTVDDSPGAGQWSYSLFAAE